MGDSLEEAEDQVETGAGAGVNDESPSKIMLGTSNKNFVAEEKTFMGLNLRSRKASMPVFQVNLIFIEYLTSIGEYLKWPL